MLSGTEGWGECTALLRSSPVLREESKAASMRAVGKSSGGASLLKVAVCTSRPNCLAVAQRFVVAHGFCLKTDLRISVFFMFAAVLEAFKIRSPKVFCCSPTIGSPKGVLRTSSSARARRLVALMGSAVPLVSVIRLVVVLCCSMSFCTLSLNLNSLRMSPSKSARASFT